MEDASRKKKIERKDSLEGREIVFQNTKLTSSLASSNDGFFSNHPRGSENPRGLEQQSAGGLNSRCGSVGSSVSHRIANYPWTFLSISLLCSINLSLVGYFVGNFTVTAELDGWLSRGTLIADQNTQTTLVNRYTAELFTGDVQTWNVLESEVQGSLTSHDPTQRRRLETPPGEFVAASSAFLDLPGCDVE